MEKQPPNDEARQRDADEPQERNTGKLKYGIPGTPEERRRGIREMMERHAETLRRLAE